MDGRRFRSMVVVAGLIAAAASPRAGAAAATADDGNLVIRGVQRRSGDQSAAVHLTVTPAPAQRTKLAATLTVGSTVVPLAVTIGRSGRAVARASQLALAGALPDFGVARLDLPAPVDATVDFRAVDCLPRSRGRILACPASTAVAAPAPDGVYDAAVELVAGNQHESIAPALASVTTNPSGSLSLAIRLSVYDSLGLTGTPDGATSVLTGYSVTGGDILALASGSATALHDATGTRVDGTATSAPFGTPFTWTFALRRPDAGTPSAAGGTWVVTFDGNLLIAFAGDATLDVTVAPDGHATTAPTSLVSGGSPVYSFNAGTCLIAPAGAITCSLPSPPIYGVVMHGALDIASGTGSGQFYVGSPPSIYADGTWTAARMP